MVRQFQKPDVSVDVVLLTLIDGALHVATHVRANAPEKGKTALIGGYVHVDDVNEQNVEDTAYRVLREKAGLRPRYLEQLKTFSGRRRDPTRGFTVAISHVALVPYEELAAERAQVLSFYDVDALPELAFDHKEQVAEAVTRVRNKSSYSTLPCWLLPEKFTLTQLQRTYEQIFGESVSRGTFRTRLGLRVEDVQAGEAADEAGVIIATDEFQGGAQRPARLFRVDQLGLYRRASW
ncbi:NUDIX hydrolase [Paraburkholderia caledonica]|uniref:ADP-ribose pyrophosphatase YjhB (NUDIX family) n=1 Tax=Paraburkholderia caledonica TaxID=134536 RepID=A0AB73INT4_9BURK|nr:ADP-ribose pyrophosphatase YjhB (NUDIX family) [Paraburkholderia caledonica]